MGFFSEISHVAYQDKGNDLQTLIKLHIDIFLLICHPSKNIADEAKIHVDYLGLVARKTCLRGFANNTGLISAFVIRFVESIICKLATGEIPVF